MYPVKRNCFTQIYNRLQPIDLQLNWQDSASQHLQQDLSTHLFDSDTISFSEVLWEEDWEKGSEESDSRVTCSRIDICVLNLIVIVHSRCLLKLSF